MMSNIDDKYYYVCYCFLLSPRSNVTIHGTVKVPKLGAGVFKVHGPDLDRRRCGDSKTPSGGLWLSKTAGGRGRRSWCKNAGLSTNF